MSPSKIPSKIWPSIRRFGTAITRPTLVASFIGLSTLAAAFEPQSVSAKATPSFCSSPCTANVVVHVSPNKDNRRITMSLTEDGFGVTNENAQDMPGDKAPTFYFYEFRELDTGIYDAVVIINRADGHAVSAMAGTIRVVD